MSHIEELKVKMARYRQLRLEVDKLEDEIKGTVLECGQTIKGHNIEVQFKKGKKTFDYQSAGQYAPGLVIANNTYPKTDWRAVCKEAGFDDIDYKEGKPTIAIKITADEIPEFPS
jgi:hypothetical protein